MAVKQKVGAYGGQLANRSLWQSIRDEEWSSKWREKPSQKSAIIVVNWQGLTEVTF